MIRCNLCWKKLSYDDDDDGCSGEGGGGGSGSGGSMWYGSSDSSLFSSKMGPNDDDQQNSCCYITSCSHILCEACAKKAWEKADSDSLVCPACDSPLIMKNIFPTNLVWNESNALTLLGFNPISCK